MSATAAEKLFEETVRADQIIWIPGAVADFEGTPDVFAEEFVENLPENADAPLYKQLPVLARFASREAYPEPYDVAELLLFTPGFLVQAATPFMTPTKDGGVQHYSWGYYRTAWLYAASEAELLPVMLAWAEEQRAAERAKAGLTETEASQS